jgi:pimeloyl-ACP methyl ester carboxylesterase
MSLWKEQTACFDLAMSLLRIPGQRLTIPTNHGFSIPVIFYRASPDHKPRPTLPLGTGFDGSQEELLHIFGLAALERSYNVLTYEGPGQHAVRRYQNKGLIAEWEHVITPILDFCTTQLAVEIDNCKIALLGYSLGGFLAFRAAAFEHRLAGVVAVDGIYQFGKGYLDNYPEPIQQLFYSGAEDAFNGAMAQVEQSVTGARWAVEHGRWAFIAPSTFAVIKKMMDMHLEGLTGRIGCEVLICEAEDDHFFKGQPRLLREAFGGENERVGYVKLGAEDGAEVHCHMGANVLLNQVVMGWF